MAPGRIPRDYALQTELDDLKEKINRVTDSLIVLIDTVKLLTCKVYGTTPDEPPQDVLKRAEKMVDSWED